MPVIKAHGIRVYSRHDALLPIDKLKPNPDNPNVHSEDQIARLAKVIETNGWRMPITVSTRSGLITKGHGRMMAAEHAGWKTVPVEYQQYKTEADEWADVIADNQLPELAETDRKLLGDVLTKLRASELNFSGATGYDAGEYDALMARLKGSTNGGGAGRTTDAPPGAAAGRKTVILHYTAEEHTEFEKLSGAAMKAYDLLTISDTMLRLVEEANEA